MTEHSTAPADRLEARDAEDAQGVTVGTALTRLPTVSPAVWERTGPIARWLVLSRAPVLTLTLGAWLTGVLLAWLDGNGAPLVALLCGVGLLLAHATNNQLNDLTDHVRGMDARNDFRARYGAHALEQGLMTPRALFLWALGTGLAALGAGLAVVALSGTEVLVPLVLGAVVLVAYTHPMKTWGLGELAVFVVWGPLMIGGVYLAMTGALPLPVLGAASVAGLGPTFVIFGKHIDKRARDEALGMGTLPVRMGDGPSRALLVGLVWLQVALHGFLVLAGALPWPTLVAWVALPGAVHLTRVCRRPKPDTRPEHWPERAWPLWFVAHAFEYSKRYTLLFTLGLLIALAL